MDGLLQRFSTAGTRVGTGTWRLLPDQTFKLYLNCAGSVLNILNTAWSVKIGKKFNLWNYAPDKDPVQFKIVAQIFFFTPLWQFGWSVIFSFSQVLIKLYWTCKIILIESVILFFTYSSSNLYLICKKIKIFKNSSIREKGQNNIDLKNYLAPKR